MERDKKKADDYSDYYGSIKGEKEPGFEDEIMNFSAAAQTISKRETGWRQNFPM